MATARDLLVRNLKRLREARSLNQEGLAESSGLSAGMIKKLERGMSNPSLETLDKLARGLGSSQSELLQDDTHSTQNVKFISEMTPSELEALVARASKRDNTINLEIERLRARLKAIPEEVLDRWPTASEGNQALCLYFLTGDARFVTALPAKTLAKVLTLLRSLEKILGSILA